MLNAIEDFLFSFLFVAAVCFVLVLHTDNLEEYSL